MNTRMQTQEAPPHQLQQEELTAKLQSDVQKGLTDEAVAQRLEEYGQNTIESHKRISPWMILLHQFKSPVVYLLLVAAAMSVFFREWPDAIAIGIVILLNAVIGFVMELQAERSMKALEKMTRLSAKVLRNGSLKEVPVENIVPGDILFLEAGDLVAADGRIADATELQADESALTGESVPVEKETDALEADTPLAERTNMVYKGTFIRKGNAHVLVTATGMKTELGDIASMVAGAKKTATPLEKKLEDFSKRLIGITVVIVLLIFGAGLLNKVPFMDMLQTSIALAVAAIPEGLPIVATLALARGMIQMAKHQVIVKKLSAVETLGAATMICTDKTGTLTENKMEVTAAVLDEGKIDFREKQNDSKSLPYLQRVAVLCNNASLAEETGDPLEVSLLQFAERSGADVQQLQASWQKKGEAPFNSDTKVMGTIHQQEKEIFISAKGATENLVDYCTHIFRNGQTEPFSDADKKEWLKKTDQLAASGLKPLAFAMKETDNAEKDFMHDLVFLGIAGFMDPPRPDVQQVIHECHTAGIGIMMLTGDHPATAANIAKQLGISSDEKDQVINGKDMDAQRDQWLQSTVFARVSPKQKLDLVDALQQQHHIVAMTGDGVNDAPALKKADIGIAMGIRGTQVSQEVADMVLKDDSFASIVQAIKQGRIIFENIRRFIIFLLSCNVSELLVIGVIALLNLPFQLVALQILFINLITDVLPAMALGFTKGDETVMQKKPKDPRQPILDKRKWISIWVYAAVIGGSAVAAAFTTEGHANNALFFTLIFSQLLHAFSMTAAKEKFFSGPVFRNVYVWGAVLLSIAITLLTLTIPPVAEALRLEQMEWRNWGVIVLCSAGSLLVIRLLKALKLVS
ncbi:cation-translocating P-type ATPase [Chitinophaga cymbidii]|uniref:ATPase n=1 Tax=Chitinophaga cymbidii TaxID=1096750 RepID=A0A512RNE5_9BACT|nr:cation-translocating P-type ATPase [Chitinophaga cymbidii]GEP97224.1 ATPase [Chitinophaga cymbidii]